MPHLPQVNASQDALNILILSAAARDCLRLVEVRGESAG
jgi:hypothetical protein